MVPGDWNLARPAWLKQSGGPTEEHEQGLGSEGGEILQTKRGPRGRKVGGKTGPQVQYTPKRLDKMGNDGGVLFR